MPEQGARPRSASLLPQVAVATSPLEAPSGPLSKSGTGHTHGTAGTVGICCSRLQPPRQPARLTPKRKGTIMERLINIDNGGTLTDIVVGSGTDFTFTKTLTTPVDLSQCLFEIGRASCRERV